MHRGFLNTAVLVTAALCPCAALAGGSGDNAVLIIDPNNADSLYVGNHYKSARGVPDRNVIYMEPNATDYQAFVDFQLDALHGMLANRGILDHIDYVIIPPGSDYLIPRPFAPCEAPSRFRPPRIPDAPHHAWRHR